MFWNKKKQHKIAISQQFKELRHQALNYNPNEKELAQCCEDIEKVYAVIVDMPYEGKIVTLVSFFNGTTNLYFSDGSSLMSVGAEHREIAKAANELLLGAKKVVSYMHPAESFGVPRGENSQIFLKCGAGILKTELDAEGKLIVKHKIYLNYLVEAVVKACRECALI